MTMEPGFQDLVKVDRDVARAHAAQSSWEKGLRADVEANADREPLEPMRHVAGRSAYLAVLGDPERPKGADAAVREGLARWIAHLTLARLCRDLDVDRARAESEKEGRYALEHGRKASWREAWRALPGAKPRAEMQAWIDVAAERGPVVEAPVRERRARREEAAKRLGLPGTWALATRVPHDKVLAACAELIASTQSLARDVMKETRARSDAPHDTSPFAALSIAVARDAPEGWPARLQLRWLLDTFPGFTTGLRLDVGPLPTALGASSFARALYGFGHALRTAGPSPSLPFALARDRNAADAHRFGAVFASLAASRDFQARALGNVARVAGDQARTVARSLLFSARIEAARFVLAHEPDRFEEITDALFGAALPSSLAGAWPPVPDDLGARAIGLFTALPLARELVDRFDADWFRNPRAKTFLRARASAPAWDDATDLDAGAAKALVRAFEESTA